MVAKNKELLKVMKGNAKDELLFDEWVQSRHIVEHIQSSPVWRQVTKKGLKGYMETGTSDWGYPLYDHCDLWKDADGKKVITSHAYAYLPGACPVGSQYGTKEELELSTKKMYDELTVWCDLRNLNYKFCPASESWYKRGATVLLEIRENETARYSRFEAAL